GQLAGLFRDYEYHRQEEIIRVWLGGQMAYPDANGSASRLESGQRTLFLRLMGPDGLIERLANGESRRLCTLPQYAAEIMNLGAELRKPAPGSAWHVFGLLQISGFHVRLLHWLGRHFDVRIYHLNPLVGRLSGLASGHATVRSGIRKLCQE